MIFRIDIMANKRIYHIIVEILIFITYSAWKTQKNNLTLTNIVLMVVLPIRYQQEVRLFICTEKYFKT